MKSVKPQWIDTRARISYGGSNSFTFTHGLVQQIENESAAKVWKKSSGSARSRAAPNTETLPLHQHPRPQSSVPACDSGRGYARRMYGEKRVRPTQWLVTIVNW